MRFATPLRCRYVSLRAVFVTRHNASDRDEGKRSTFDRCNTYLSTARCARARSTTSTARPRATSIALPRWIGAAYVKGRLFDFGRYPGLVIDPEGEPIRGDVFQIDDALVPVLDEIEEVYPGVEGLFRPHRVHVTVDVEGAAHGVDCLMLSGGRRHSVDGLPRHRRRRTGSVTSQIPQAEKSRSRAP